MMLFAAFLINGECVQLPTDNDTVCQVDEDFELFPGVTSRQVIAQIFSAE